MDRPQASRVSPKIRAGMPAKAGNVGGAGVIVTLKYIVGRLINFRVPLIIACVSSIPAILCRIVPF